MSHLSEVTARKVDFSAQPKKASKAAVVAKVSKDGDVKNTFRDQYTHLGFTYSGPLGSFSGKSMTRSVPTVSAAREIFKPQSFSVSPTVGTDANMPPVNLRKAIVKAIRVSHTINTFPYDLIFDLEEMGIPSNSYTSDGQPYAFMIRAGDRGERDSYQDIHISTSSTEDQGLQRYGHLSNEDLKAGIVDVEGADFSLVASSHPIVNIITRPDNMKDFGYTSNVVQKISDTHYKIPTELSNKALNDLSRRVINNFKFNDLSMTSVRGRREDSKAFTDFSNSHYSHIHPEDQAEFLDKHVCAGFALDIKWTYPSQDCGEDDVKH